MPHPFLRNPLLAEKVLAVRWAYVEYMTAPREFFAAFDLKSTFSEFLAVGLCARATTPMANTTVR